MSRRLFLLLFLTAFFDVLGILKLQGVQQERAVRDTALADADFRRDFYSGEMWEAIDLYSTECQDALRRVQAEARYFPVPLSTRDASLKVSYVDSWMGERKFGGERGHEGTDLMASEEIRGLYPVVSMSDGTVSNLGWLEQGGYRVGISTEEGTYYYYAHLDSYANIKRGDPVKAGELLGFMGDTGYGEEKTTGMFPVHLHVGIYFYIGDGEVSVNPYYVLKSLEGKKLKYQF